eukprot:5222120-Amphidinium_carterae.2
MRATRLSVEGPLKGHFFGQGGPGLEALSLTFKVLEDRTKQAVGVVDLCLAPLLRQPCAQKHSVSDPDSEASWCCSMRII